MKYYYLYLVIIILLPILSNAQSSRSGRNQAQKVCIDTAVLRVTYRFSRATDTISHRHYEDLRMLEIGKEYTRDFSLFADHSDSIAFETYRKDPVAGADLYGWMQPGQRGFCEDYYSNYPKKGEMLNTFHIINTEYRYSESMPEFQWQIQSSDVRNIFGYECHKAITAFRGRIWTAWYTTQIPVLNAPWKFNGLPGLILNVYDRDHYFEYTVVGIEKGSATPIFIYGNSKDATLYNQDEMKIINTTEKKVKSLQTLFWKNPIYLSELHGIKLYRRTKTGQTIAQKSDDMMLPYIPPLELE